MKVLITGNEGYIGKVLTQSLIKDGFEVVGLDANYYKDCYFGKTEYETHTIKQIVKDIRKVKANDLKGIDVVCHLAALSNDPLCELNTSLTEEINHKASLNLARLSKKTGVKRFIFSSSCSIYGISEGKYVTEESKLNPLTKYAKSKAKTERDISKLASKAFSPVFLRNATAYGMSPKLRFDLVLNNLIGYAFTTGKIKIKSDGTPWRPLIHVKDISKAFITIIEAPTEKIHNKVFNIGKNEENYQIKNLADIIKSIMPNCEIEYTYEHTRDIRSYKVNFDKIHRELPSFKPIWNVKKGITELLKAFKKLNLTYEEFIDKKFTRLKHLKYLLESNQVNDKLYWR